MKRCNKTGKVRHASNGAAHAARKRQNNCLLNVYSCPACKGWHLGQTNNRWRYAERIDQLLTQIAAADAKRAEKMTGKPHRGETMI